MEIDELVFLPRGSLHVGLGEELLEDATCKQAKALFEQAKYELGCFADGELSAELIEGRLYATPFFDLDEFILGVHDDLGCASQPAVEHRRRKRAVGAQLLEFERQPPRLALQLHAKRLARAPDDLPERHRRLHRSAHVGLAKVRERIGNHLPGHNTRLKRRLRSTCGHSRRTRVGLGALAERAHCSGYLSLQRRKFRGGRDGRNTSPRSLPLSRRSDDHNARDARCARNPRRKPENAQCLPPSTFPLLAQSLRAT